MNTGNFLERIYRLMNLNQAAQKRPRQYGSNVTLYAAEVHMLEIIGDRPGIMSTELAARLAISKGAVSQTLKKLAEKGLVRKSAATDGRAAALFLTEDGEKVWKAHQALHEPMLRELQQLTEQLTPEAAQALERLGEVLEAHLTQITQED